MYPAPCPGRENLKDCVTFATGKGIHVSETTAGHDGATHKARLAASRLRPTRLPAAHVEHGESHLATPHATAVPAATSDGAAFDPSATSVKFLRLETPTRVRCHTNCGQASQGTAFLALPVRRGERRVLRVSCTAKPGRMRYFVGAAPRRFDVESGQAAIARAAYSLENLKARPHTPGSPCEVSAPPSFHTGSTIMMTVDLRDGAGEVAWAVDTSAVSHVAAVSPRVSELHPFISLYNRDACFEVEEIELRSLTACGSG